MVGFLRVRKLDFFFKTVTKYALKILALVHRYLSKECVLHDRRFVKLPPCMHQFNIFKEGHQKPMIDQSSTPFKVIATSKASKAILILRIIVRIWATERRVTVAMLVKITIFTCKLVHQQFQMCSISLNHWVFELGSCGPTIQFQSIGHVVIIC